MMRDLVVGCYQFAVATGDVDENLRRVEKAVERFAAEACRLLVLPEMWSCGFSYPSLKASADRTAAILDALQRWSRRYGMVLVGSLPEREQEDVFNTSFVIDGTGDIAGKYRKIHLFSLHGEQHHFGRGKAPLVCGTGAGRLGIEICYDLRFPELSRRLALDGAEVLCISAQWPVPRIAHWSILLRARAIENQLFVIGCNGCGPEGLLRYGGASVVVSPTGKVLAEAGDGEEYLTARVKLDDLREFREHIACFSDRFPEAYD